MSEYKVEHYKESLDGAYVLEETEELEGASKTETTASEAEKTHSPSSAIFTLRTVLSSVIFYPFFKRKSLAKSGKTARGRREAAGSPSCPYPPNLSDISVSS